MDTAALLFTYFVYLLTLLSASFFTYENTGLEPDGFPYTEEPIWILGRKYSLLHDRSDLEADVRSRIWFSYRKGFTAIGGTGPTSDQGWGCMLRCGQMMLAQALINRHLTRDWRLKPATYDPKYFAILQMFLDRKDACYSVHQIASMGVSEGKAIGEWFGPNTIAQVLRKLAIYDTWSGLVMHVAMDNSVIVDDIRDLCRITGENSETVVGSSNVNSIILSNYLDATQQQDPATCNMPPSSGPSEATDGSSPSNVKKQKISSGWRPLLLVIPLRLGLSEINSTYFSSFKACFTLKQSVGVIGGKPSHAHWFIGFTESKLFYFDPHTIQPYVDVTKPDEDDTSFHLPYPSTIEISQLDPSLAVGFFCSTEDDFDDLCKSLRNLVLHGAKTPLFELHAKRPRHFPPVQPPYCLANASSASNSADFTLVDKSLRHMDSLDTDEEFEILDFDKS